MSGACCSMKNQNQLFPLPDAELPAKFSAFLVAQVDASHRSGYPKRGEKKEKPVQMNLKSELQRMNKKSERKCSSQKLNK